MFTMWPGIRSILSFHARRGVAGVRAASQGVICRAGVSQAVRVYSVGMVQSQVCGVGVCQTVVQPVPARFLHTTNPSSTENSLVVDDGEPDRLYSVIDVECRGHDPAVLRSYLTFLSTAASHLGVTVQDVAWPTKHIKRWTLLKSVHIHKKHRVQYEARTHFLTLSLTRLTQSTADTYLEYIQRNLPEGVAMKVTRHELQKLPQHVKPSSEVSV